MVIIYTIAAAALENWPDLIVESGVHFGKESYVLLVVWIAVSYTHLTLPTKAFV